MDELVVLIRAIRSRTKMLKCGDDAILQVLLDQVEEELEKRKEE